MNVIIENMSPFFNWFFQSLIETSALIRFILIIERLFKKYLLVKWRYVLWSLLILKIILSLGPLSIMQIDPTLKVNIQSSEEHQTSDTISINHFIQPGENKKSTQHINFISLLQAIPEKIKVSMILLWALGIILFIRNILNNYKLSYKMVDKRPLINSKVLNLLEDCKEEMNIKTPLIIVESINISSPAIFGFIRPRLLLPKGLTTDFKFNELRFIIKHELAHIKRKDIITKIIRIVCCFHY